MQQYPLPQKSFLAPVHKSGVPQVQEAKGVGQKKKC